MSQNDFDMSAAAWRSNSNNQNTYLEALAARLSNALPGAVKITRSMNIFVKNRVIKKIIVTLGDQEFVLQYHARNGMQTTIGSRVRNITLKTDQVDFPKWLALLNSAISATAAVSSATDNILKDFLL